jgi:hypothetical protein
VIDYNIIWQIYDGFNRQNMVGITLEEFYGDKEPPNNNID